MVRSMITSTLSMLATLAIAYGIDWWTAYLLRITRRDFTMMQAYTWGVLLGGVVLLLVWLASGWYFLVKSHRNRAVSVLYIVAGLLAFLWLPLELVSRFWALHLYFFSFQVNNLQYTGLFLAALGVLALFTPKTNPA